MAGRSGKMIIGTSKLLFYGATGGILAASLSILLAIISNPTIYSYNHDYMWWSIFGLVIVAYIVFSYYATRKDSPISKDMSWARITISFLIIVAVVNWINFLIQYFLIYEILSQIHSTPKIAFRASMVFGFILSNIFIIGIGIMGGLFSILMEQFMSKTDI
jgi:hypothetical protein